MSLDLYLKALISLPDWRSSPRCPDWRLHQPPGALPARRTSCGFLWWGSRQRCHLRSPWRSQVRGEQVKHLFDPTTELNLLEYIRNISLSLSWQLWRTGLGFHSQPVYPLVSRALGGKCRLMSLHLTDRNYSTIERENSIKLDKRTTKARCGEPR